MNKPILSCILLLLLSWVQCNQFLSNDAGHVIKINNNMARTITRFQTYFLAGGMVSAQQTIKPGRSATLLLDNYDLTLQSSIGGLVFLSYAGSKNHIAVGWNISEANPNVTGNSDLIGIYTGTNDNLAQIYTNIFGPGGTARQASLGWTVFRPTDTQISVAAFMSSDHEGNIEITLEESYRLPQGQFLIQAPDTQLYLKYWAGRLVYDVYSVALEGNFKWNLEINVPSNPNITSNTNWVIYPSVDLTVAWKGLAFNNGNEFRQVGVSSSVDKTLPQFQWEVSLIENDLYSFRSLSLNAWLDSSNCEDSYSNGALSCYQGRIAGMTYTNSHNITNPSLQFRLIPVDPIEIYPQSQTTLSLNY